MSNKVKCLFNQHDLYYNKKDSYYHCKSCPIMLGTYDGGDSLCDYAKENEDAACKTPYFYNVGYGIVMTSNIKLTAEEVSSIYAWAADHWEGTDEEEISKIREGDHPADMDN